MKKKFKTKMVLGALVLALGGGCGGAGDSWLPDDIDRESSLDLIGDAAFNKLCNAFDGYVRDRYRSDYLVRAACTAHAVSTTETAETCGDVLAACLDTPPAAVENLIAAVLDQASCDAVGVVPDGCDAPVSQIEGCLDALGAELDGLTFTLTCAAAGQPINEGAFDIDLPSECSSLIGSCTPPTN